MSDEVIGRLWLRMAEIYGHRWTSAYGDNPKAGAGKTWGKGLAGLSLQQIGHGVERCLIGGAQWPPTLPEFRAMCLGIPTFEAMADEVSRGDTPATPFRRLVWSKIDGYAFRRAPAAEALRLLRSAYSLACDHVMAGKPLPEPPAAVIEHKAPEFKPASPEVARAALDQMAAVLKINQSEEEENADQANR